MNLDKESILITGGTGFIGNNFVRSLLQKNYTNIHLLIRKDSKPNKLTDILSSITLHTTDFADYPAVKDVVTKINPTYIFHLAAYGNSSSHVNVDTMIQANIIVVKNLLEASKELPYKCFVNIGSSSEYGFKKSPMKEDMLLEPVSFYAATKASGTYLCEVYAKLFNKPIVTFRPFSVYGPYEDEARFIPTVVRLAIENQSIPLTSGTIRRDFIYIDDLTNALIKAMTIKLTPGVYNIGTGIQYSNDEVIKMVEKVVEKPLRINKGAYKERAWDTDTWVADISKTTSALDWKPTYSLQEGIKAYIEWYINNIK